MDDTQAKKRRERCQGIVGDISPMQPPNNPEPMAAGPDSPARLGGTGLPAATLKAVHEATAVTESVSEQGGDQKEVGPSKLEQDERSPEQKGVGEDVLSFKMTEMNVTEGEEKNRRPGHSNAPSGVPLREEASIPREPPTPHQREEARRTNERTAPDHTWQEAPLNPSRKDTPLITEQDNTTAGVESNSSSQEQGHPGADSPRIMGVREWGPPGETERLALSQHKEVRDLPNIGDTTSPRGQTSSDAPGTQGTTPGSTNQLRSSNPQDG